MGEFQDREVTVIAQKLIEVTRSFLSELNNLDNHWNFLFKQIKDLELERGDLLHENELSDKVGAPQRSKFWDQLKEVSVTRRKYKDDKEILEPFKEWFNRNKDIKNQLFKVLKEMDNTIESHKNRVYTPRIRKDLSICEQQETSTEENEFSYSGETVDEFIENIHRENAS